MIVAVPPSHISLHTYLCTWQVVVNYILFAANVRAESKRTLWWVLWTLSDVHHSLKCKTLLSLRCRAHVPEVLWQINESLRQILSSFNIYSCSKIFNRYLHITTQKLYDELYCGIHFPFPVSVRESNKKELISNIRIVNSSLMLVKYDTIKTMAVQCEYFAVGYIKKILNWVTCYCL